MRKEKLDFLDPSMVQGLDLEALLPSEVEDEVMTNRHSPSAAAHITLTTGFNIHSRLFWAALTALSPKERKNEFCACIQRSQASVRISHLQSRLHELRYMLDNIPQQLRPWATTADDHFDEDENLTGLEVDTIRSQFQTIRANIHVTHLWLQSIILDGLEAIVEHQQNHLSSPSSIATPSSVSFDTLTAWSEREDICRQLLHVLHSIPEFNLETNGLHLAYKIRDIAVGLLACPYPSDSDTGQRASQYLRDLTDKLSRLDRSEALNSLSLQSWVDTEREGHPEAVQTSWT